MKRDSITGHLRDAAATWTINIQQRFVMCTHTYQLIRMHVRATNSILNLKRMSATEPSHYYRLQDDRFLIHKRYGIDFNGHLTVF